jgi:hypothetical protein
MINLIRAEWLKLSRRPLSWILLILFLVLLVAQILTQFALTLGMPVRSGIVSAQFEEWRRGVLFPGIFATALSHVNGLGGIFAVIFAAGAIGSEYSWGTLRTQLARDPARDRYLLAKLTTIMLMLATATLLATLLAALLSAVLSPILGSAIRITPDDLMNLIVAITPRTLCAAAVRAADGIRDAPDTLGVGGSGYRAVLYHRRNGLRRAGVAASAWRRVGAGLQSDDWTEYQYADVDEPSCVRFAPGNDRTARSVPTSVAASGNDCGRRLLSALSRLCPHPLPPTRHYRSGLILSGAATTNARLWRLRI